MIKILGPVFVLVMITVITPVSSDLEAYNGELYFTTPGPIVVQTVVGAKSWCTAHSSQLAVVRDTNTQMALTQFLNSSGLNSTVYINVFLIFIPNAWNLVTGENYAGGLANQRDEEYWMFCCLHDTLNGFIVEASRADILRYYICYFEYNKCSISSADNMLYKEKCYVKYENENLTWHQARERCINNGGDLATFNYDKVNRSIFTPPFNTSWLNPPMTYWVGIRRNQWSWKYPEGNEAIYTSWSKGYPNNIRYHCVCLDPNGIPPWSWTDCNCTVEKQFVCLKTIPRTTMTTIANRITATSLSTVTDQHSELIPLQQCKSEALIVGLVLGIGAILPLTIIILVLVIRVVHLNRRLRKNTPNYDGISQLHMDRSTTDSAAAATDVDYEQLQMEMKSGPGTATCLYDQLSRPESEEYEKIPQNR